MSGSAGGRRDRFEALFARRTFGIRPGLDAVRPTYAALGEPAAGVPAVHIVGTNGKGSVAAMVEAALARRAVGLYTSPHLRRVTERVRVRGAEVDEGTLLAAIDEVLAAEAAATRPLSFFEVLTLGALVVFERAELDTLVVEAGLGGRLDTTRLVDAAVVVVTSIARDHEQWLGDTLGAIAAEKAGVFRPGVPIFTRAQPPEVMEVLVEHARRVGEVLHVVDPLLQAPLPGEHQRHNAALALAAARVIDPTATLQPTRWPGRLERVGHVLLDVAHNPAAIEALVNMVEPMTVLFACAPDKDLPTMTALLAKVGPIWTVQDEGLAPAPRAERAFPGLRALGPALEDGRPLLVCGSHRLVGAVQDLLAGTPPDLDPTDPR